MPSPYESLSVIVLEAWAMGRPVLVNAACRVLEGQCVRSGGGLFYRGYAEFAEALRVLVADPALGRALGRAGRAYVRREYDWDVVEERVGGFSSRSCGSARGLAAPTTGMRRICSIAGPAARDREGAEGEIRCFLGLLTRSGTG